MGLPIPLLTPQEESRTAASRPTTGVDVEASLHSITELLSRLGGLRGARRSLGTGAAPLVHPEAVRIVLSPVPDPAALPGSPPPLAPASDGGLTEEEDEWAALPPLLADPDSDCSDSEADEDLACPWGADMPAMRALLESGPPVPAFGRPRFRAPFLRATRQHGGAAAGAAIQAPAAAASSSAGASLEAELAGLACKLVAVGDKHAAQLAGAHPQVQADLRAVANRIHAIAAALAVGPPPPA